jgi:hypothetical protein
VHGSCYSACSRPRRGASLSGKPGTKGPCSQEGTIGWSKTPSIAPESSLNGLSALQANTDAVACSRSAPADGLDGWSNIASGTTDGGRSLRIATSEEGESAV